MTDDIDQRQRQAQPFVVPSQAAKAAAGTPSNAQKTFRGAVSHHGGSIIAIPAKVECKSVRLSVVGYIVGDEK